MAKITLAVVALLAGIAVALPNAAIARSKPSLLSRINTVASAHWPASPCRGHERIEYVTSDFLLSEHPEDDPEDTWLFADSWAPTCDVRIAKDLYAPLPTSGKCSLLEHEYGHLAGLTHTDAQGNALPETNVMSDLFDLYYPTADCAKAFPEQPDLPWPTCSKRTPKVCRNYGHPPRHQKH